MQKMNISPHTPKMLVRELRRAGSVRGLATQIGVNHYYVQRLLKHGEEPSDKSPKSQALRVKLFLPRYKRKARGPQPPLPAWLKKVKKKIQTMRAETKQAIRYHFPKENK